jgi:integrase
MVDGTPKPFSHSSMWKSFGLALAKLNERRAKHGHPPIDARPYDLRHSFGTMVAERTPDERALQTLLMHSSAAQSRRYTERATQRRVATAIEQVRKSLNR